jgi:hypothetical protein
MSIGPEEIGLPIQTIEQIYTDGCRWHNNAQAEIADPHSGGEFTVTTSNPPFAVAWDVLMAAFGRIACGNSRASAVLRQSALRDAGNYTSSLQLTLARAFLHHFSQTAYVLWLIAGAAGRLPLARGPRRPQIPTRQGLHAPPPRRLPRQARGIGRPVIS